MPIAILPARLANQIAAGEVVERPASVVKELVENSLDAGATRIQIDIEKGGAKRIRITDNGSGIAKEELTLALSRHATSKIQNLDDLEAISSLGFRGEALASISSVARLTLISKPASQDNAWQAYAEGRDMAVTVQPAAHPDGTTIDVSDLFFNTPARRKFLRTEKTEFTHIEEVIRRIALANFNVTFVLNHNQKMVKTYRAVTDHSQYIKRIGQVCGQSFVDHAIEINCQHDDIHLWGWLAKPSFTRNQNDLCYSYVNGRMMRDKLINHAIRQAYGEFIDNEVYAAFVLYLSLDYKEVDVNVHPAKHEVRFHQGRYVHDFIYSVCHKALFEQCALPFERNPVEANAAPVEQDYIMPLRHENGHENKNVTEPKATNYRSVNAYQPVNLPRGKRLQQAAVNYQQLMSVAEHGHNTVASHSSEVARANTEITNTSTLTRAHEEQQGRYQFLTVLADKFLLYRENQQIKLADSAQLAQALETKKISQIWSQGLTSQPLLLPVKLTLSAEQMKVVNHQQALLQQAGIVINVEHGYGQIRQFPALLREQDVLATAEYLILQLSQMQSLTVDETKLSANFQHLLAGCAIPKVFNMINTSYYWQRLMQLPADEIKLLLELNSVPVDLTSAIDTLASGAVSA